MTPAPVCAWPALIGSTVTGRIADDLATHAAGARSANEACRMLRAAGRGHRRGDVFAVWAARAETPDAPIIVAVAEPAPVTDVRLRRCSDCGQHKPLDTFARNASCPGGRAYRCRACDAQRNGSRGDTLRARVELLEQIARGAA